MTSIIVFGTNTDVKVKGLKGITATITGVCIYTHDDVEYQIAYFQDGKRVSQWVKSYEVSAEDSAEQQRISFK